MARTRQLDPLEIRVVGALMEKEQTTPDYYPMTLNALVAACNQKSNRDPVMQLARHKVYQALENLRQDVLVWRSDGARSERWQHSLDRRWELDRAAKAIMTLLLLRGPQTPGELRSRSERMHAFTTVGEVEEVLQRLQEGFDALVRELPRAPGQRESRWQHLVGTDEPAPLATASEPTPPAPQALNVDVEKALEQRLPSVEESLARLEQTVEALSEELQSLRQRLGDA